MDVLSIVRSSLLTFITGAIRNLLAIGVTWLVSRKVIDASASSQLLTFTPMVLASIAWSFFDKYVLAKLHLTREQLALNLPAGSTIAHLDEAVRRAKASETDNA